MPHTSRHYVAEGPRVAVRRFRREDGDEFVRRVRESKDLHAPWLAMPDSEAAYAEYADRLIDNPARAGFLVCEKDSGDIAGFININNIVRGGFQCGALGYGAFAHAAGRGLMREALEVVIGYAFGPLGLHRLEINVQPGNTASIALARGAGFRLEGFSPKMIQVGGEWRDHERWALTTEMRAGG
ncbi:GNAT family protein [Streptomyces sp. NPDC047024]|uniref:GNAT family N-acetyltransferase n=1 Tax=Streptomyces sp. NPDC047024 TaxID=3155476 RepID=UPI0033C97358